MIITAVKKRGQPGLKLRYRLTEEMFNGEEGNIPTYGVAVTFIRGDRKERAEVGRISTSREEVAALLERLKKGKARPVSLRDIVEDFLFERDTVHCFREN